jgi:hypothetical protein
MGQKSSVSTERHLFTDLFACEQLRTMQLNANETIDEDKQSNKVRYLLSAAWAQYTRDSGVLSMSLVEFYPLLLRFYVVSQLHEFELSILK